MDLSLEDLSRDDSLAGLERRRASDRVRGKDSRWKDEARSRDPQDDHWRVHGHRRQRTLLLQQRCTIAMMLDANERLMC